MSWIEPLHDRSLALLCASFDGQKWSQPATIDTREAGFGNYGHEAQFMGLTDAEKRSLIEYLKLL